MKSKVLLACASILIFYSCQKDLSVSNQEPVAKFQDKSATARFVTADPAETDPFFTAYTPDPAYEMMFTDRFLNNHIGPSGSNATGDWWMPRVGAVPISWQNFTSNNRAENNDVSNGKLSIKFNQDTDGKYYGGGIISQKKFGYGYYQARVKLYTGTYGLHQSFWSFTDAIEIDGLETDSKDQGKLSTLQPGRHRWKPYHVNYQPTPQEKSFFVGVPNTDILTVPNDSNHIWGDTDGTWYTVGYEWLPGEIKYYINGVLKNTYPVVDQSGNNMDVYQPANVWITAMPYKLYQTYPMVTPQQQACMQVENFAYYAKRMPGVNLIGNSKFDYINDPTNSGSLTREEGVNSWVEDPLTDNTGITYGTGDKLTSYVVKENNNWYLEHKKSTAYQAVTRQTLSFIHTGSYKLSADIRCSTGGSKFIVLDKNKMVIATRTLLGPHPTDWVNITLDNIPVNNNEVTILIYSNAQANDFLQVDNVKFEIKP